MRLLLDEHFSPRIAEQLRGRGHDVIGVVEASMGGRSDPDLLAFATSERRAILTENVTDFIELARRAEIRGMSHFGLVFTSSRALPRSGKAIGRLVQSLDTFLTERPGDDARADQTHWLAATTD